jgi:quercetin dioxygenase-like cupin family protein
MVESTGSPRLMETLRLTPHESVTVRSVEDGLLEVEAVYEPGKRPPPPHFHPAQDESFEVLEGVVRVRIDGAARDVAAGESFEVARGTVHQMWNPSPVKARVRWQTRPASRTLQWFRALDALNQSGSAGPLARAGLLREYRDVFRLAIRPRWLVEAMLLLLTLRRHP